MNSTKFLRPRLDRAFRPVIYYLDKLTRSERSASQQFAMITTEIKIDFICISSRRANSVGREDGAIQQRITTIEAQGTAAVVGWRDVFHSKDDWCRQLPNDILRSIDARPGQHATTNALNSLANRTLSVESGAGGFNDETRSQSVLKS